MINKYLKKIFITVAVVLFLIISFVSALLVTKSSFGIPSIASYIIESKIPNTESSIERASVSFDSSSKSIVFRLHNVEVSYSHQYLIDFKDIEFAISISDLLSLRFSNLIKKTTLSPEIEVLKIHGPRTKEELNDKKKLITIKRYIKNRSHILSDFTQNLVGINVNIKNEAGDKPINMIVKDVKIDPTKSQEFKLDIGVLLEVNHYKVDLKGVLDLSGKELVFSGVVKNIPITIVDNLLLTNRDLIKGDLNLDVKFSARSSDLAEFSNIEFEVISHNGFIKKDENLNKDIYFEDLDIAGYCLNNCEDFNIEKIEFKTDKLEVLGSLKKDAKGIIDIKIDSHNISFSDIIDFWPDPRLPDVKKWLSSNLKKGVVDNLSVDAKLDIPSLTKDNPLKKDDINIKLDISNAEMLYMPEGKSPPLKINKGLLEISAHDIKINAYDCKMNAQKSSDLVGYINFDNKETNVKITGNFSGPAQDLIDLVSVHSGYKIKEVKSVKGNAETSINLTIPISKDDFPITQENFKISSKLEDITLDKLFFGNKVTKGDFDIELLGPNLHISGNFLINERLKTSADLSCNIFNLDEAKVNLDVYGSASKFRKSGFDFPSFISKNISITAKIDKLFKNFSANIDFDFRDSSISLDLLGIKKEVGADGILSVNLNKNERENEIHIDSYELNLNDLKSNGNAVLSNKFDILSISADKIKFGKSNFGFKYDNHNGDKKLTISGNAIDLSKSNFASASKYTKIHNSERSEHSSLKVSFNNLKKLIMKNNQIIDFPSFEVYCNSSKCIKANFYGDFKKEGMIKVFYNYPVLSIVSDSAEKVLSSLGVSNHLYDGEIDFRGKFVENNEKEEFHSGLYINNYRVKSSPSLSSLLALSAIASTSFISAKDALSTKGIPFRELFCDISYEDDFFKIPNFSAKGSVVSFGGFGFVDTNDGFVHINGTMAPTNVLNSFASKIPIIGPLIAGGKDRNIIYTNFTLKGDLEGDPKVTVNPISTFAPGFLGKIFDGRDAHELDEMILERKNKKAKKELDEN